MNKIICWSIPLFASLTAITFAADLVVGTKNYKFEYEVVESAPKETFVVQKKTTEYRNPLVVGFKILPDGTIAPIDTPSAKAMHQPPKDVIETNLPEDVIETSAIEDVAKAPEKVQPEFNNGWLTINEHDGQFWAMVNGSPENGLTEATKTAVQASVPKISEETKVNDNETLTVLFEHNSSLIRVEDKIWLKALPTIYPNARFMVTGYTCSLGSLKGNQRLAERRAQAVAEQLKKNGANVQGKSAKPMCCYLSETEPWKNRRVEITINDERKETAGTK